MTKTSELEAPPRVPTGALAIGWDPCLYRRFCCQLVVCAGPSWPATQPCWAPPALQPSAANLPTAPRLSPEQQGKQPSEVPCLHFAEMPAAEAALKWQSKNCMTVFPRSPWFLHYHITSMGNVLKLLQSEKNSKTSQILFNIDITEENERQNLSLNYSFFFPRNVPLANDKQILEIRGKRQVSLKLKKRLFW